jgi:hypothetical protein
MPLTITLPSRHWLLWYFSEGIFMSVVRKYLAISFLAVGLGAPCAAQAEVGAYVSFGAATAQTKSTYEGGLLFPLSEVGTNAAPLASQYIDPGFAGATQTKTGLRLEVGYDFFFYDEFYVGAFWQFDSTGVRGGNKPKTIGSTRGVTGGTTAAPVYSTKDFRYQVATDARLGPSNAIGLTAGRNFDQFYLAASVGYGFTNAELTYGAAFDSTFGTKLGTSNTVPATAPALAADAPFLSKESESLRGIQFGLEAGYSLNEAWDVVASASTVDYGKIAVLSPAGGSKLAVAYTSTRGGITLRRRF